MAVLREISPWWWTEVGDREQLRLLDAFSRRRLSMGEITTELEARLASFLDVPYVLVTPSGTAALTIALMSLGVGPGDEVICPDFTWVATAQAAHILGARVTAVDSHPDLPLMDVSQVTLSKRTRAIIPVHYNGRACDLKALYKFGIPIVEDACKALGAQVNGACLGTLGTIGCFSLGLVSLVTAVYGGAVATRDTDLYLKMRSVRDHGVRRQDEAYLDTGFNFKFSDLLAAIALGQMERLEGRREALLRVYDRYAAGLQGLQSVHLIPVDVKAGGIPLLIDVVSPRSVQLRHYLVQQGVETAPFHPPLHTAEYLHISGRFPNAERFWREGFNLPSGPGQSLEHIDRCIQLLEAWDGNQPA